LRIGPDRETEEGLVPVWLHFDAKYRIDSIKEALSATATDGEEETSDKPATDQGRIGAAKQDDIMKMHAYRDAIKRSAGAYVIYPGEESNQARSQAWPEYHEILPGLGAFALRPSKYENDQPEGASSLRSFIKDVIQHVGSQITRHERGRYWMTRIHSKDKPDDKNVLWAPFLPRPPADTWVALAHLDSEAELAWIQQHKLFPLSVDRATQQQDFDPRVLTADIVVVYGALPTPISLFRATAEPEVLSGSRLQARGFPRTDDRFYYCLRVDAVADAVWSTELSFGAILRTRQRHRPEASPATPIAVTWLDLVME
jgi:hypothetical protein